jgi:hypothetical protein
MIRYFSNETMSELLWGLGSPGRPAAKACLMAGIDRGWAQNYS